jgi:hypothetical protein
MNDLATQYLYIISNLGKKEKKKKEKKHHYFLLHHRKQALVFIVYNYHPFDQPDQGFKAIIIIIIRMI